LRSTLLAMRKRTRHARSERGFTLVEIMIIVAMIGVLAALGGPALDGFFTGLRLKAAARDAADALRLARVEAIRTGTPHMVFFSTGPGDVSGAPLPNDPGTGGPMPIVILRDNNGNCIIDGAEPQTSIRAKAGLSWGTSMATAAVATDDGAADYSSGSSFKTAVGAVTNWVRFRSDGVPSVPDAACTPGSLGSGAGALYLTNGRRDYAVVMSALGNVRVHMWQEGTAAWSD
jgi:prepilin-type N-terminal cleavage/methylation domain-containing protein